MPSKRSYADHGDACAAAHGIEVMGEVWTYPILREMFLGPKRFGELADLVRGITPAVLTTRLKELQARGLVRHVTLPPPARGNAYELTDWGHALQPITDQVARWAHASPTWRPDGGLTPDAAVQAMRTMAGAPPETALALQLELYDERLPKPDTYTYAVDWTESGLTVSRATHPAPDAVVRAGSTTWTRALFEAQPLDAHSVVAGDPAVVTAFLTRFATPGE